MNSLSVAGLTQGGQRQINNMTVASTPTVTLDRAMEGKRRPDVVKIDVEGAEFRVLRGMTTILASAAVVLCELHPYAWAKEGHSGDDLRSWLGTHGRRMLDLDTGQPFTEFRYGVAKLIRDGG